MKYVKTLQYFGASYKRKASTNGRMDEHRIWQIQIPFYVCISQLFEHFVHWPPESHNADVYLWLMNDSISNPMMQGMDSCKRIKNIATFVCHVKTNRVSSIYVIYSNWKKNVWNSCHFKNVLRFPFETLIQFHNKMFCYFWFKHMHFSSPNGWHLVTINWNRCCWPIWCIFREYITRWQ